MSADNDGKVSQNADNPMNHVGLDIDNLELTVLDFLNIPSPHITPYHMLDIFKKIKEFEDAGYIGRGLKEGRADTFFITDTGREFLEGAKHETK